MDRFSRKQGHIHSTTFYTQQASKSNWRYSLYNHTIPISPDKNGCEHRLFMRVMPLRSAIRSRQQ
jgi:hypothetical protein